MTNQTGFMGAVDLHLHGAFGIDIAHATVSELNELSFLLFKKSVSGFCPTTLSAPMQDLRQSISCLGKWIRSRQAPGAKPLGIHLEGPFINPDMRGAHSKKSIRPFDFQELEALWTLSLQTLKIITIAPEILTTPELSTLCCWSKKNKIRLSIGHSLATETQALKAFKTGFSGVTHAWNALAFHHRAPGVLGAALGQKGVRIEVIIDQMHVHSTVIRWLLKLHSEICFVSDCVPARGSIAFKKGASRFADGSLAGGGILLPQAYDRFLKSESKATGVPVATLFQQTRACLTTHPLKAIGINPNIFYRKQAC